MYRLIEQFVTDLFDSHDYLYEKQNIGFNVGRGIDRYKMSGSYFLNDSFTHVFMNTTSALSNSDGLELLSAVYNYDGEENKSLQSFTINPGKKLFFAMFKHVGLTERFDTAVVFRYIINYFHKYNIKFSSMFNQLTFPSILFGSGVFRSTLSMIKNAIGQIRTIHPGLESDDSSYDGIQFRLIRRYLELSCDDNVRHLFIKNMYQCGNDDPHETERKLDSSFKDTLNVLLYGVGSVPSVQIISNQYLMPSVNNAFLSKLLHYLDDTGNEKVFDEPNALPILQGTSFVEALRYFDISTTQLTILFMLLKKTSYYDYDLDKDKDFIETDNNDIFSA
jgi:hypothetical protein